MRFCALPLVLAAMSCGGEQPTRPSRSEVVSQAISTVSGVVYEATSAGLRPLAGVAIDVSPEGITFPPTVITDADGRFSANAAGGNLKVIATKVGYSQPCRALVRRDTGMGDVYLAPDSLLSSTGAPASMPVAAPLIRGRIIERVDDGSRPIAGASIIAEFTSGLGWDPSATTRSDAAGAYLLCNMGAGAELLVFAEGYKPSNVFVRPGVADVDIELHR